MASASADNLTAKQQRAIAALISEPTVLKAAQVVGVTDRTLYRWLDNPMFSAEFRRVRREAFAHSVSMAQKYAPAMMNTLAGIAMDKSAAESARVSASKAVLDYGRASIELDEVVHRVEKLEGDAAAREKAE